MHIRVLSAFFDELEKIAVTGVPAPAAPSKPPPSTATPPKIAPVSRGAGVPPPAPPGQSSMAQAAQQISRTTLGPGAAGGARTQVGMIAARNRANAPPPATQQVQRAPSTQSQMAAASGSARAAAGPVQANRPAIPAASKTQTTAPAAEVSRASSKPAVTPALPSSTFKRPSGEELLGPAARSRGPYE